MQLSACPRALYCRLHRLNLHLRAIAYIIFLCYNNIEGKFYLGEDWMG
jgi:hypothetical protein